MRRISVNFSDEIFSQLEKNAANQKISISGHVVNLVQGGLRLMNDATNENHTHDSLHNLRLLISSNLQKTLESQYLIRYLIEGLLGQYADTNQKVFGLAKEKAQEAIEKPATSPKVTNQEII